MEQTLSIIDFIAIFETIMNMYVASIYTLYQAAQVTKKRGKDVAYKAVITND